MKLKSILKYVLLWLILVFTPTVGAVQILYGVGYTDTACTTGISNQIYTVSPSSGFATQVSTTAVDTPAAGVNPLNGFVYYVERNVANPRVYYYDPAGAVNNSTLVGNANGVPLNGTSGVLRTAFSPDGRLYVATNSGRVYEINTATAAVIRTITTNLPTGGSGDMAFDSNGDIYFVANDTVAGNPYQLYRGTAAAIASGTSLTVTAVGTNLGIANTIAPNGLALIPPQGTCATSCFAMSTGANNRTYLVNGTTGSASVIGTTGFCITDLGRGFDADLAIRKIGPATYTAGATVTYTLQVWNNGPAGPIIGTITDNVPASITGVTWTCTATGASTCGAANGSGNAINTTASLTTDTGSTTTADTSFVTYTITGTADATFTPKTNTATVTKPVAIDDSDATNNTSSVTTNSAVDLVVNKTSAPNPYTPGQSVTYTIKVWNKGPSPATASSFSDTLPALAGGASWSYLCTPTGTATCGTLPTSATTGNNISGNTGLLPVNNVNTPPTTGSFLTITATTTLSILQTATLNNTATINPPADRADTVPGNNSSTDVNSRIGFADLSLTKIFTPVTPAVGSNVTFTIQVSNGGPDTATNVVVNDLLPSGYSFVSSTQTQGTYTSGTGDWVVGSINNAANATLTIVARVLAAGTYTNTAQVKASDQADLDSTPNNNAPLEDDQSSVTPVVNSTAAITISKSDGKTTSATGNTNVYTITVNNAGAAAADGAVISDNPVSGVTCIGTVSCVASGGATCPIGSPVTAASFIAGVTIPAFPSGGSLVFTLTCYVN